MDRRDHLRAVADRRRHPFDRAGAHVADREHAAPAGFERELAFAGLVAGEKEAARIALEARRRQPVGIGLGADEGEEVG